MPIELSRLRQNGGYSLFLGAGEVENPDGWGSNPRLAYLRGLMDFTVPVLNLWERWRKQNDRYSVVV